MSTQELSLLARYDDSIRHPLLTFQESDWLKFINDEIKARQELSKNNRATCQLQEELKKANYEKKTLEFTLTQVRRDLEEEMLERQRLQTEVDQLARQMQLIKELVGAKGNQSYNQLSEEDRNKLAFLNNSNPYGGNASLLDTGLVDDESYSLLSESEYDKTGDDLLTSRARRRSKRKSQPRQSQHCELSVPKHVLTEDTLKRYPMQPTAPTESEDTSSDKTPPKRRRFLGGETETSVDTEDSLRPPPPPPQTGLRLRRSNRTRHKRSLSAGAPIDDEDLDTDSLHDMDAGRRAPLRIAVLPKSILKKSGADSPATQSPPESPTIRRWASASKLQRQHNLFNKNVMKPETCTPCGKKIRFGNRAYKCKDCKVASHVECKARLSELCIPTDATPIKGTSGNVIGDFAPSHPPFVPSIILQCVNEVESRGFTEEGIYRKSGSEREVKELKERFLKGKDPKLENICDIHVVCGCLKDFLRNLKEPLIPTSLWTSFVNAAKISNEMSRSQAVRGAIKLLPVVNMGCVAFIIIHLQRVSERPDTRMGVDNLAKVFGPTMVGYSVQNPQPMQMIAETQSQQAVMTSLLEHHTDYWTDILSGNHSEIGSLDYDVGDAATGGRHNPGFDSDTPAPKSAAKVRKFFGESPRVDSKANKTFFPSPMLK